MHKFAAVSVTGLEMGYANIQHTRWLEMLRYHNRIMELDSHRLPKIVYEWEKSLGSKGWIEDVGNIASALHLPPPDAQVLYDMDNAECAALALSRKQWDEDALTKSKLDSYVLFRNRYTKNILAKMKLNRRTRSAITRLAAGILPIEVEIGRYTNIKREKRLCKVCHLNKVEDEAHFLFSCAPLQSVRSAFYVRYIRDIGAFMMMSDADKIHYLISKPRIKELGVLLEALLAKRRWIMYRVN